MQRLDVISLAEPVGDRLPIRGDLDGHGCVATEVTESKPRDVFWHCLQIVAEWRRIEIEVDEDQPLPRVNADREQRELSHRQRSESLAVRDSLECAGKIPRPAVIAAAQLTQVRTRAGAQRVAAVTAHVLEGAQGAVVTAHNQYRVRPATVFEVVTGFGDVVDCARDLPHPGPHPLQFELCECRGVIPLRRHQSRPLRRRADRVLAPDISRWVGRHRSSPVASVTVLHSLIGVSL